MQMRSKRKATAKRIALEYRLKVKEHPELVHIVDFQSPATNETYFQMSIKTYNSIIDKIFSNVDDGLDPTKVKYALSFTKNISEPGNVIKPAKK